MVIFTLILGGVLGGCAGGGGSNGTPATVSAPVVLLTSPADNATGVLLTKPIAVAFSKEMKADAFTATTFTATSSSGTVSGAITYINGYATLTPTTLLAPSTLYTVTVAGGVQASDGSILAVPYSWSFTTGLLDPNFGNGGVVISPISMTLGDGARAVAVQMDGKIVAVGYVDSGSGNYDFAVARYHTDGSLDTTFDGDGIVITAISAGRDEARAVAIQPDGQIVVAGVTSNNTTGTDFVVARYNLSDGSLDTSFNSGGYIVTDFGATNDEVFAVALQSTGNIVVVGQTGSLTDANFALARYTTTGMLDVTFGISGLQVTSFGDGFDAAYAVAIQANDNKIVVAGISDSTPGLGINNDFALARYDANGVLDPTFDNDGKVMTAIGVADEGAFAVGIQSTGKIVAAGAVLNAAGNNDFGVVRYNVDGSLDTTFAAGGSVPGTTLTDMAGGNDVALALMIQPDDKIMVGGAAFVTNQGNDLALARYDAEGGADMTFDADGKIVTNISAAHDTAYGLALRPASGGKVVLAGSTGTGSAADFLLVGFIAP
jgi:uncharacterized delta-60 repeat protein